LSKTAGVSAGIGEILMDFPKSTPNCADDEAKVTTVRFLSGVRTATSLSEARMPAFTEETIESILSTCGGNTAALAESLSQCFDRPYRLEAGDSGMWSTDDVPGEFRGPGILALIQVESQAIAVLIPQSLPLPDWYLHPNDSQTSRLETLAME